MRENKGDKIFLLFLAGVVLFGLIILASASAVLSYENLGSSFGYLNHQILYGVLPGIFFLILASKIKYPTLKKITLPFMIITIFLLVLLFIPSLSFETKGASRWLHLSLFTFQPSEVLKLSFILYLAAWFESRKKSIGSLSEGLLPFLMVLSIIAALLIAQPDIGTLGVIILIGVVMYFSAGAKYSHFFLMIFLGLISLAALISTQTYRLQRWLVFLNPELDPLGSGYQVKQSLIAIGSGGLFGLGFGMSHQKYNYLPEPMGDSIFAITAEELGFIGALFFIFLFVVLAYRGFQIAKDSIDTFGRLTAVGITSWISVQSIVNIGAISGLLPLTGIPLPFISYGGTSMLVLLTACGILYNISKR